MAGRLERRINNISLRNKMLGSFLLLLVLPLLLVGITLMLAFRDATLNDSLERTRESVDRVAVRTMEVLETIVNLATRISTDERMKTLVSRPYKSVLDVWLAYREYETFRLYEEVNPEVSRIKIYVDNPYLIDNWAFIPLDQGTMFNFWYQEAMARPDEYGWFSFPDITRRQDSHLSLVRTVALPDLKRDGLLVIDINTERLSTLLRTETFTTVILDSRSVVAAASDPLLVGKHLGLSMEEGDLTTRVINGVESRVFAKELAPDLSFNNLRVVSFVALDAILADADRISLIGLGLMLGVVLLSLSFMSFLYSALANRLLNLSRQILVVSGGQFTGKVPVDGRDEIGLISTQFNTMVDNVATLMEENRRANEEKTLLELGQKEIRFKMLASQINPHFLFNALESIRMKAWLKGEKEIARIVKLLGRLMRKNLEAGEKPITLAQEMENVETYLEIEKFRMAELLEYHLELDNRAAGVLVPPLIMEPLVENAVIHGLAGRPGGGKVRVRVQLEGDRIRVVVEDDGAGMAPERLRHVVDGLDGPDGRHIGMANIHQRLVLRFGHEHGILVESRQASEDQAGWTRVSFSIPMET